MNRNAFVQRAAVGFAAFMILSAARCDAEIEAAITATDAFIVAQQKTLQNACASGEIVHQQIIGAQQSGLLKLSAADAAKEMALYNSGLELCAHIPSDIPSLIRAIPLAQDYAKKLAAFKRA